MSSHDRGRTWSAASRAIPSNALDRFETDSTIPLEAKQVPWDGARGAIDSGQTLYMSAGYPAPPTGTEHSQRFFSVSLNGIGKFGLIRASGDANWPERWDGDIAAAGGEFIASYIGGATP